MNAAAIWIACCPNQVKLLGIGNSFQVFHGRLVAAEGLRFVKLAVDQHTHLGPAARGINEQLQARVGVGNWIRVARAPVLVVKINPIGCSAPDSRCTTPVASGQLILRYASRCTLFPSLAPWYLVAWARPGV